jgi:hypothetical protein
MKEAVQAVESDLGVDAGFLHCLLDRLLYDDDWSFIVKLHALMDACITLVLTMALTNEDIRGVVSRLPLNDQRRAFIKTLKLLPSEHLSFIRQLTSMRNDFAHDIRHIDLKIDKYVANMPRYKRKDLLRSVAALLNEEAIHATCQLPGVDFVRQHPKLAIYIGAMDLIAHVYMRSQDLKQQNARRAVADLAFKNVLARIRADPANLREL